MVITSVEKYKKKVSILFFLGQIEKIIISMSSDNLDAVNLCDMACVTQFSQ